MQASHTVSARATPASSLRMNSRALSATAAVAAIHVALLAVILTLRHDPTPPAIESRVMTAQLLPPAPVAAPVALQSIAPPPPKPTPPVHTKAKVQPKPTPTPKPAPTPLPEAAAPSPTPVAAPDPTPPAPAAPPVQAAPAVGRPTMEITAPKNVSHIDCNMVTPEYPSLSKRRGETGTAYVKFVVGLTGKLENIELKKSSGFNRLDDAALAAAHASACKPYLENGQPVRAAYTQPYNFNLND
ncbi:energy transducer TonB [Paraburkholderia fungorum]|uniref:energy transducer TonB n=1 Tax=Paraburkholderia fungorum TaxID=134537 RepID=UPI001182F1AF|nr:energy transducer TonB [Paraburkholderia fungorum]USU17392.1 energy transducer TonB [Paraburkholderia fungorum]USU25336.1 energy transducer TonB [Paraburkholderia fungorum]